MKPLNEIDRLSARIKRATDILHPHTCHKENLGRMTVAANLRAAVNDAFNVLEWGKTLAEEEKEVREVRS
jgi:hypothetical protein